LTIETLLATSTPATFAGDGSLTFLAELALDTAAAFLGEGTLTATGRAVLGLPGRPVDRPTVTVDPVTAVVTIAPAGSALRLDRAQPALLLNPITAELDIHDPALTTTGAP
jgi:hypothetical protein